MPGYTTRLRTLQVGGQPTLIRALSDKLQFHDPLGEAERRGISSAAWPLFGLVWPSALVLAGHLQTVDVGARRVLELGCGLGLGSLALHRRERDVTASDNHPLAGEFLAENVRLNALPPLPYRTGDWAAHDDNLGRFDLFVASDVLYDRGQPQMLSDFIARHANAVAEVLVVDPDRGNRSAFNQRMAALGFSASALSVRLLPEGEGVYKGRVLRYLRTAG
jgi:predicted nicotinamide N-methyase